VVSGEDFPVQDCYEEKWDIIQSKQVYIDVFLLRKKDGKRLELTKNYEGKQLLSNRYIHEFLCNVDESLADCDDGLWRWDLPVCPDPNLALAKAVRFEATLHYKDRNERAQVPPNLDDDQFQMWLEEHNDHDYDLLLSGFKVSLAGTRHPEDWEYEHVEDPEDYPRPTYRNNDVDGLLATVSGPGWSQRWM
jgi:hypothetical protein